ncbi:CLUMA_CG019938, isoform A [Clunio marinus]|uniref:CLUMA_CG019938, isoform A n=1 Tax=Clunio marinus TaxID=568069 RepID=A0A1J1J2Y7_9DIPT|nr:CLUMA_CG019938, isoform A [Clunio marinus]
MESRNRNFFSVILLCIFLMIISALVGFYLRNLITVNSETSSQSVIMNMEVTTARIVPEKNHDGIMQAPLGTVIDIAKEIPKFFFLLGSKLLIRQEENTSIVTNVFSVTEQN